jgi:hypothetical protein
MPKPDLNPINLGSIARGAALELFDMAMEKVTANIADSSTDASASREITLKFRFKPDEDRRCAQVTTTASTKLAGCEEHVSKIYLGKDESGKAYAFDSDPRQEILFQPPPPERNLLEFNGKQ